MSTQYPTPQLGGNSSAGTSTSPTSPNADKLSGGKKPHPKAKFTQQEDNLLKNLVAQFGENNWNHLAEHMPHRNMRQCKERWQYYLSPSISKDPWTYEEDCLLKLKYKEHGPKWVRISLSFPNRTDAAVKNRWLVLARRAKREVNNQSAQLPVFQRKQPPIIALPSSLPQLETITLPPHLTAFHSFFDDTIPPLRITPKVQAQMQLRMNPLPNVVND